MQKVYCIIAMLILLNFSSYIQSKSPCAADTDITHINQNDKDLIEGDIVISRNDVNQGLIKTNDGRMNAVARFSAARWDNWLVPYVIDSSLSSHARRVITRAMEIYELESCIRFVPRTSQSDYALFRRGSGCSSYIGRVGGMQPISIGPGCDHIATVLHEIFHLLGRSHEQNRPDRDTYVRIRRENVKEGLEENFEKASDSFDDTQGIGYDYKSIMHYGQYTFSKNSFDRTIETRDRSYQNIIGKSTYLTRKDIEHVNLMYNCNGRGSEWTEWGEWSTCDQRCRTYITSRKRTCRGSNCPGRWKEYKHCGTVICGTGQRWSSWSSWSTCSATCGNGKRFRTRSCRNGSTCRGNNREASNCNLPQCTIGIWGSWSAWSQCSQNCGGGTTKRSRLCTIANTCNGISSQTRQCNTERCPDDSIIEGIVDYGCFAYSVNQNLYYYKSGSTFDLNIHDRASALDAIRVCSRLALNSGRRYFAILGGLCILESPNSNRLNNFILQRSTYCVNQVGDLSNWAMNVWLIFDGDRLRQDLRSVRDTPTENETFHIQTANGTEVEEFEDDEDYCGIEQGEMEDLVEDVISNADTMEKKKILTLLMLSLLTILFLYIN